MPDRKLVVKRTTSRVLAFGTITFIWLAIALTATAATPEFFPNIVREPQRGIFLVAGQSLTDPNFSRAVVLLTEYGPHGSVGLIVNKISTVSVVSTLPEFADLENPEAKIRFGGPLQIQSVRLLVRTANEIPSAEQLFDDVYFVNSTATLEALLTDETNGITPKINYYAGYAGWFPGQLNAEIARGDWHMIAADQATIFEHDNATIWLKLIEKLEGNWVLIDNAVVADTPL